MDTSIQALFRAMLNEGWFTTTDGDVEAVTGFFGYVTNLRTELKEIREAFADTISMYGDPEDDQMIGNFLVIIDSNGSVHIRRFITAARVKEEFDIYVERYSQWMGS